jgi:hypothetical protein
MRTKFLMIALFVALSWTASAQQYRTAGGLMIDIGDGTTLVGPTVKHFFTGENAIAGSLLFGNNFTVLSAEYSYNKPIQGAEGLNWNIGVGPQLALGLEFKIPSAPLALGFDWRPLWHVDHGSNFTAGRFGLTFKYVFSN